MSEPLVFVQKHDVGLTKTGLSVSNIRSGHDLVDLVVAPVKRPSICSVVPTEHRNDFWIKTIGTTVGWLVRLDLFNDDTHLSGYISRPSHVGFSHICLSSTKMFGGVVWLRILSVANSFKSRVVLDIWPFLSDVVYMKLKKNASF